MEVVEHHFRVMASDAIVILNSGDMAHAQYAEERLRFLEAAWSRFVSESDITRLNNADGVSVAVAPETVQLVQAMVKAWTLTAGRYYPTLLPNLIGAGYAASTEDPSLRTRLNALTHAGPLTDITIDARKCRIRIPAMLSLDAGGIGKGLAADLVAHELVDLGVGGALVSIGGDLAAKGVPTQPRGWIVGVQNPFVPTEDVATLFVNNAAVCTSSTRSRRWVTEDGHEAHHLIDPGTGRSSNSSVASVSAIAPEGWLAEAHAKAALLEGEDDAIRWLDSYGVPGVVVYHDGTFERSAALTVSSLIGANP